MVLKLTTPARYVLLVLFIIVSCSPIVRCRGGRGPWTRKRVLPSIGGYVSSRVCCICHRCHTDRHALHPQLHARRLRPRDVPQEPRRAALVGFFLWRHPGGVLSAGRAAGKAPGHTTDAARERDHAHARAQQRRERRGAERAAARGPLQQEVRVPVALPQRGAVLGGVQNVRPPHSLRPLSLSFTAGFHVLGCAMRVLPPSSAFRPRFDGGARPFDDRRCTSLHCDAAIFQLSGAA